MSSPDVTLYESKAKLDEVLAVRMKQIRCTSKQVNKYILLIASAKQVVAYMV